MPTGDVSTRGGDDDLLWILQYVELPPDAAAAFTRLLFSVRNWESEEGTDLKGF